MKGHYPTGKASSLLSVTNQTDGLNGLISCEEEKQKNSKMIRPNHPERIYICIANCDRMRLEEISVFFVVFVKLWERDVVTCACCFVGSLATIENRLLSIENLSR